MQKVKRFFIGLKMAVKAVYTLEYLDRMAVMIKKGRLDLSDVHDRVLEKVEFAEEMASLLEGSEKKETIEETLRYWSTVL